MKNSKSQEVLRKLKQKQIKTSPSKTRKESSRSSIENKFVPLQGHPHYLDSTTEKPTPLKKLLQEIKEKSQSTKEEGIQFENLMKKALKADDSIAGKFDEVYQWHEWPHKDGADTGIDLVAVDSQTKEYVAIQCKFYDEKTYLNEFSTFTSKANTTFDVDGKKRKFSRMILISTTEKLTSHARKNFEKQNIPSSIIHLDDLEKSKIDWENLQIDKNIISLKQKKTPKPYQAEAIQSVVQGFKSKERGKLIMACGTGKTFTSLKLMENMNKNGDFVLFLVPSIALMSQTIRGWLQETSKNVNPFAVCSDKKVGKDNDEDISPHDIPYLATTNLDQLEDQLSKTSLKEGVNIIFSTYQSIDVLISAQKKKIIPHFNLTICDEAHRTTGFNLNKAEQSHFTKVHHEVLSNKKLYMTATPRVYRESDISRITARNGNYYSMDDDKNYGLEFFRYGFSQAVKDGNLSDYKVMVLAIPDNVIGKDLQTHLIDENNELEVSDVAKITGCFEGLKRNTIDEQGRITQGGVHMKRAVAFCRTIKESKKLSENFSKVTEKKEDLVCHTDHVDGNMNAGERTKKIQWFKRRFF